MKYCLFIISLAYISLSSVQAQDSTKQSLADSLYHEWETNPNDSLRLYAIIQVVENAFFEEEMDSAYRLSIIARKEAEAKNIELAKALIYQYLGNLSHVRSNYDSALHYDLLALKAYRKLNSSYGIATSLNSVGEDYFDRELYSQAYDYYYKALKYSQEHNDSLIMAIATYNIGRVLKEQEHYERALAYFDSSLVMSKNIGDEEGLAYSHFDIADVYMKLGRNDEALEKLSSALEVGQTLGTYMLIPKIYDKLGEFYYITGDYEEAISNYKKGLNYSKRLNNKIGIGENYHGLGITYKAIGNYGKAEEYLKSCLSLATEIKSSDLKGKCYLEMSRLFEDKGQVEQSLAYFKKYKEVQDTLFNAKKSSQLAQLQMQHATQQQELQIDLLNQKQEKQAGQIEKEEFIRNILVVLIAIFAILIFSLYKNGRRRRRMNKILLKQQKELEQQRSELLELNKVKDKFFSIISHDLRSPINSLAGISSLLVNKNVTPEELSTISESLEKQLKHAVKLLDNLMDWVLLQSNEIRLRKEQVNLRNLVDANIEYFRETNDKDLHIENNIDDVNVVADKNMLDLVIRNLLSNAIKFTQKNGSIKVDHQTTNGSVTVIVKDNGVGIPNEMKSSLFDFKSHYSRKGTANEKGTGLGLKLCKEFIERNGGKIWVESEEGKGSTFKFTLEKAEEV